MQELPLKADVVPEQVVEYEDQEAFNRALVRSVEDAKNKP
jgi:hypothetical protein